MLDVRYLADLITLTLQGTPFPSPEKALPLLLGTAAQESSLHYLRQRGGGPARGLFQMESLTERDHARYVLRREDMQTIFLARCAGLPVLPGHLECNFVYQILLCRLHYYVRDPQPLPEVGDLQGQADTWKRCYNTVQGKGTTAEYVANYQRLIVPHLGLSLT